MINYVNNAYDKCLKPCDAQQFSNIINSPKTEELITLYRSGDSRAKPNLPALTYMGVFDKEKWPPSNPPKGGGTRKAEFMRPTGLLMLDFDHVGASPDPSQGGVTMTSRPIIDAPIKLWEYLKEKMSAMTVPPPSQGGMGWVCLAHITPSGDGLRVVVKRPVGMTIEQAQYEWCQAMELDKVGIKPDAACKDISRLSFAPMQKEVLYFNPSLLFGELPEASDYPDGSLFSGVTGVGSSGVQTNASSADGLSSSLPATFSGVTGVGSEGVQTNVGNSASRLLSELPATSELLNSPNTFETEYNGVSYSDIVSRLEEQLGGRPERGARNAFIFTMACNLRYICNDDAQWVASILPTYGEEPQKHRMTIQSAINRPMSREMPETLKRALGVAKMCSEGEPQHSTLNTQHSTLGSASAPIGSPRTDSPAHLAHSPSHEGGRGHGGVPAPGSSSLQDGVHVYRQPTL